MGHILGVAEFSACTEKGKGKEGYVMDGVPGDSCGEEEPGDLGGIQLDLDIGGVPGGLGSGVADEVGRIGGLGEDVEGEEFSNPCGNRGTLEESGWLC